MVIHNLFKDRNELPNKGQKDDGFTLAQFGSTIEKN